MEKEKRKVGKWAALICTYCGDHGFNFTQNALLMWKGINHGIVAMKIPMCQICAEFFAKYRMSALEHDCEMRIRSDVRFHGRHWLDDETAKECRCGFNLNTGTSSTFVYYCDQDGKLPLGENLSKCFTNSFLGADYLIDKDKLGLHRQIWLAKAELIKLYYDNTSLFSMLPDELLTWIMSML